MTTRGVVKSAPGRPHHVPTRALSSEENTGDINSSVTDDLWLQQSARRARQHFRRLRRIKRDRPSAEDTLRLIADRYADLERSWYPRWQTNTLDVTRDQDPELFAVADDLVRLCEHAGLDLRSVVMFEPEELEDLMCSHWVADLVGLHVQTEEPPAGLIATVGRAFRKVRRAILKEEFR